MISTNVHNVDLITIKADRSTDQDGGKYSVVYITCKSENGESIETIAFGTTGSRTKIVIDNGVDNE